MGDKNFYENKSKYYGISIPRRRHILDLVPLNTKKVLDVGCATGELAKVLREKGMSVTGIDISQDALNKARPFLLTSYCFDVEKKEWPSELVDERFDLIIASEVVEHIFSPDELLFKLKKLLNKDGKIILTTPNFLFWKNRLNILFGNFRYRKEGLLDYGHIRFYTIPTMKEVLSHNGLKINREHHFYPNLEKRGFSFLGPVMSGLLAFQMIFLLSSRKNN